MYKIVGVRLNHSKMLTMRNTFVYTIDGDKIKKIKITDIFVNDDGEWKFQFNYGTYDPDLIFISEKSALRRLNEKIKNRHCGD